MKQPISLSEVWSQINLKNNITKEVAIEMAKSGWWHDKTPEEIVSFQLYENLLCMDFSDFHGAVEKVLGRSVYTHEFGSKGTEILKAEFEGRIPKRTLEDSISLLESIVGRDKIILIKTKGEPNETTKTTE